MTAVLSRADRVSDRARQIRLGRVLLAVFAAVFFAVGWLVGRFFLALVWVAVAVKFGFTEGRGRRGPGR